MPFSKLGLAPKVVDGVRAAGYTVPTPIQLRAIPVILEGRDLIGSAQTGTGKTAAFALPIISRLGQRGALRALVLEPTRELAAQVETAIRDYARFTNLRTVVLFGGTGYGRQDQVLRQGADIVVATPGRLLDQIQRGMLRLSQIEILVLDEADRMLDMGFLPDVRRLVERCPRARQTMLFSATIPPEIEQLCNWALRNPETIEIGQRRSPAETVTHALYAVDIGQKQELLEELLRRTDYDQVLIFCRTKHGADRVARKLNQEGHAVAVLHSNRTQSERERALNGFRDGRYEVMVATDIAARGIDVEQISHVINFDVPHHPEDYVHRIGRTGRAQSVGDAFTIMTGEDVQEIAAIERFIGQKIPRVKIAGFNYAYTRLLDSNPKPIFGGGRSPGKRSFGYGRRRR
ncbi:MAG: DEAD/DEAH box helicase [Deltaproteobacteria bacterium]|nr:MAG: DEAD/DEAH box helicase [Deltaproteobacteria bacterium]